MLNDRKTNKTGYMATQVACGWAGTIFQVTRAFGQWAVAASSRDRKKLYVTDRQNDQPLTGIESRRTRLKTNTDHCTEKA